jgi:hypothetical protein
MPIIHLLQRIASIVSADDAMRLAVLVAVIAAAISARTRYPEALKRHRLALGSLALGAVALLLSPRDVVPTPLIAALWVAAAAGFVLHTVSEGRTTDDESEEKVPNKRALAAWAGVALAVALLFLVADLGGYAGALMVWEPESSLGLVEAYENHESIHSFAAKRMLWDQGVVSAGHHSLLYGTGTYALWQLVGVSTTTLRLMSVLLAIACLPIAYIVGRETGSSRVATAAAVVMAINPIIIFYGRYGTSLAATFFSVLLMLWSFQRLSDPTGQRMWIGLVAGAAAFLATLAYSPARVVTAAVVVTTIAIGLWNWPRLAPRRRLAFGLLVATLAVCWLAQERAETADNFVNANHEQVFSFAPEQVREFFGEEMDASQLTRQQRRIMAGNVFKRTLADYRSVLSFFFDPSPSAIDVLLEDPPPLPLTQGPLLLFALWGFVNSLAHMRRGWPLLLLAFLAATTLPLLLTTRVDIHRLSVAIVPITVWVAIGVVAAGRVARACGLSATTRHSMAAIFIVLAASSNSRFLFFSGPTDRSHLKDNILTEIAESPFPVALALEGDYSLASEFRLDLLDRETNDCVLPERVVIGLRPGPEFEPYALALTQEKLHCSSLVLAPREAFQDLAALLQERGASVQSTGDMITGLWRVDPIDERGRRVIEVLPRHPVALSLRDEPREFFSDYDEVRFRLGHDLEIERDFESEEPRYDEAWNGDPMVMDGVAFHTGIGMHADSEMKFTVPNDAVAFEAVIGLNDGTQGCEDARVIFELWDDGGHRIFASEPRVVGDPPQLIHVPLGSTTTVELAVTEDGGRHACSHGNWAEPVFLVSGCLE